MSNVINDFDASTASQTISVLAVSDHPLEILGLESVLKQIPDMELAAHVADGADALALCRTRPADVVVLSLVLPGLAPTLVTRELVALGKSRIVGVAGIPDGSLIRGLLAAGISGVVQRRDPPEVFVDAIRAAHGNQQYLSGPIERLMSLGERDTTLPRSANAPKPLTPREREVLKLIADGETTNEIATRLSLSVKTIETHRKNVMDKLQTRSIAQLTKLAIQSGLTTVES